MSPATNTGPDVPDTPVNGIRYRLQFRDEQDDELEPPNDYIGVRHEDGRWRIDGVERWTYDDDELIIGVPEHTAPTAAVRDQRRPDIHGQPAITNPSRAELNQASTDGEQRWIDDHALLQALAEEFAITDGTLDGAVEETEHEVAAQQYNDGEFVDLDDRRASVVKQAGVLAQMAHLARDCRDVSAFRSLLADLTSPLPEPVAAMPEAADRTTGERL